MQWPGAIHVDYSACLLVACLGLALHSLLILRSCASGVKGSPPQCSTAEPSTACSPPVLLPAGRSPGCQGPAHHTQWMSCRLLRAASQSTAAAQRQSACPASDLQVCPPGQYSLVSLTRQPDAKVAYQVGNGHQEPGPSVEPQLVPAEPVLRQLGVFGAAWQARPLVQ